MKFIEMASRSLRGKCIAAVALLAFCCGAPGFGAVVAGHVAAVPHHVSAGPLHHGFARNPHLHGANSALAEREAWEWRHRIHEHFYVYHHWHHRWNYVDWVTTHRGSATIRGIVVTAEGRPVDDAAVMLRGQRGAVLKADHLTHTGSGGNFTMTGVPAGRYRVRAEVGKADNHVMVSVHPGQVATVGVRM
jgi:hypothetical protein